MPKAEGDDDLMDDSDVDIDDDEGLSLSDSDEEGHVVDSDPDDEDEDDEDEAENGSSNDGDGLSLVEASDNEDLISLNGDVPDGLIEYDGSDADHNPEEEEVWGGISGSGGTGAKRKREGESKSERRKKLRSLPTFASYEDYAKMIEDGPEDDI
jgi:ribosome biogenesis protein MAK21